MKRYIKEREKLFRANPHLKAYQEKRRIGFFGKLFLIEVIAISFAVYLMDYVEIAWVFGLLFGILLPRLLLAPQKHLKKVGLGEIVDVLFESRIVTVDKGIRYSYRDLRRENVIVCRIMTETGREIELEYISRYERVFSKGDKLIMLPFVKYPINLIRHDWYACPFCGNLMPSENKACIGCGRLTIQIDMRKGENG